MDILFSVKNQSITRVDSNVAIQLSKNYLKAKFEFKTPDWDGLIKTAIFISGERKWNVVLVDDECLIPYEATKGTGYVYVSVFAGDLITANTAQIYIGSSGYTIADAPPEPTPDVYNQITTMVGAIEANDLAQNEAINTNTSQILSINNKLNDKLPDVPEGDGTYVLKATRDGSVVSYSWELETI